MSINGDVESPFFAEKIWNKVCTVHARVIET